MNEQNRHRNTMSGTSGRTVQVGAVQGDLTITDGRARRRLAVCAPLAAVALVLGTSPATTPAPAPPAPPPVAESSAPPPPWTWGATARCGSARPRKDVRFWRSDDTRAAALKHLPLIETDG